MTNDDYNIKSVIKELNLEEVYEEIRILDPIKKKVFNLKEDNYEEEAGYCFSFWDTNSACKNCISMRAFREDKVSTKIQNKADKIYMVTSIPVNLNYQRFVVELFKEVTDIIPSHKVHENELFNTINDEVIKDTTTNVYNRRYLDERIQMDISNSLKNNWDLTILLANIDNLKIINRKYGHFTGDAILSEFANEADGFINNNQNWIARYSGDEFLICFNNSNRISNLDIAEKIRQTMENRKFSYGDETFTVTVSLGVAGINEEISTFEDLLDNADINLQIAKNTGRNKVITDECFLG